MAKADGPSRARRVLVVEDDPATRTFICDLLREEGYDAIGAVDGMHALRLAAVGRPDAIVLDFELPLLSGEEFTVRWREQRPDDRVPVIGVSGHAYAAEAARRLGLEAFLAKPFAADELLSLVARHTSPTDR